MFVHNQKMICYIWWIIPYIQLSWWSNNNIQIRETFCFFDIAMRSLLINVKILTWWNHVLISSTVHRTVYYVDSILLRCSQIFVIYIDYSPEAVFQKSPIYSLIGFAPHIQGWLVTCGNVYSWYSLEFIDFL